MAAAERFPAEHTGSWYAASRRYRDTYPALDGDSRCDVAVVGGGLTGVTSSLALAERGFDVLLLEANRIGWGASGRNGGQLIDGFVNTAKLGRRFGPAAEQLAWDMGIESRNLVVANVERHGIECDLKFNYLDVASTPREMRELEASVDARLRRGYPHVLEILDRDQLRRHLGSPHYTGAVRNGGNGHLHPLDLCAGEARAAAGVGARIHEQTPVTKIVHGAKVVLRTPTGDVTATTAVLAGNAYLAGVEPALAGSVVPAGSYMIATGVLSADQVESTLPTDMAICEQRAALDYYRLSGDRRLLYGGGCHYLGLEPRSITAALRPRMLGHFPQLESVTIDHEWGGKLAISINRIPQFGRIGSNVYYGQGYSGHGIAPTHLGGKMLADVVAGESEGFELLARVRPWRLPGGRLFANPVLALGMLYYRLRDRLG